MANMQIVPAWKNNVEAQYVEMKVPLYSYGCERKVKKALAHLKGIYSVNVDFQEQKVTVWGICNKFDVLTMMKNKRKESSFWNSEDNDQLVNLQKTSSSSSMTPPPLFRPKRSAPPPLALIKARSLSLKLSLKKVFIRSYSF
ncbi:hypothetical protein M9H77_26285 [Catharanthus roseus]|uniref:Uncharacterized protein n=1 Tax=Catharanthus roseus TaxID=4058 RepID=A0ACC0A988_CATRO|nr:hypothetical protein M9H77_26285 [Catharanthus roseus]